MIIGRFRIFREHKYIFDIFSNLIQKTARADFNDANLVNNIRNDIEALSSLHDAHSAHEDGRISDLLIKKNSKLSEKIKLDHSKHKKKFEEILSFIDKIIEEKDITIKFDLAHILYLDLRHLFAELLIHLDYEERVIMKELQNICNDEEIKSIDHASYQQMLPEHIIHMMETLIPHFNNHDIQVFLEDIYSAEKEKFITAWPDLKKLLDKDQIIYFEGKLSK